MQRLSRLTLRAIAFLVCASAAFGQQQSPSESAALAISANIQGKHMPFGAILDPIYAAPASVEILGYTHCGDSALWTGAYLAAEAFRYGVTRSPDALTRVKAALSGLKGLSDVTGDNRLARCMFFSDSPYALGMENEEAHNTIHQNSPWIWIGNTSRDQIVGAFFGLGVAYDVVDDAWVKSTVSDLTTRLIGFISRHRWSPNDDYSSTFELRPESLQMLLQVARHVNPSNSVHGPFFVAPVDAAVFVDVQSNDSYYKFNLDYMSLYHLVRLQDNDDNRRAYDILRSYTALHQNAFFDIVDRALGAVNATAMLNCVRCLESGYKGRGAPPMSISHPCSPCAGPTPAVWCRSSSGRQAIISGSAILFRLEEAHTKSSKMPVSTISSPIGWAATTE